MNPRRTIAWAAVVAVSAGAGWIARGSAEPATPLAAAAANCAARARVALPVVAPAGRPLIAVSSDGQVTLRVEQQPLDWVLEQIALQSGRRDRGRAGSQAAEAVAGHPGADAAGAAGAVDAAEPSACPTQLPADPARLLFVIEHGPDGERADALLRARADALPVPEPLLRTLIETAASERVRVVALESWLELRAGDPKAERAALEAALLIPSEAVQQEARQRLDDLDEMERLDALAAQGGSSP